MGAETPEKSGTSIRLSQKQVSFLIGILIAASLLILILLGTMAWLLIYGLSSGSATAIMGATFCVTGASLLIVVLTLTYKVSGLQQRLETALASGRETKAKEEPNERPDQTRALAQESQSKNLSRAREAYSRAKADLSARYNRAKNGEY